MLPWLEQETYAIGQYKSVANYMKSLGVEKPIHIGKQAVQRFQ
jgi:hypothetical protein